MTDREHEELTHQTDREKVLDGWTFAQWADALLCARDDMMMVEDYEPSDVAAVMTKCAEILRTMAPHDPVGWIDPDNLPVPDGCSINLWGDHFRDSVPLYLHPPAPSREREALVELHPNANMRIFGTQIPVHVGKFLPPGVWMNEETLHQFQAEVVATAAILEGGDDDA